MIELRVTHALDEQAVRSRLETLARHHGVQIAQPIGAQPGSLEKDLGILGRVRAEFDLRPGEIVLRVDRAPALLGEANLRRLLERELQSALAVASD